MAPHRLVFLASFGLAGMAGCGSPADPSDELPIPPPGPHVSVSPLPIDEIARITALGLNNKVAPNDHSYWHVCDDFLLLQSERPCNLGQRPLRAPGSGVVRKVGAQADGYLSVEGPPGLTWTFGHVTPAAGMTAGATVMAGQVVATMYQQNGFDFGVRNFGVEHFVVTPARYPDNYRHAGHPIAQFPLSVQAQLLTRVNSVSDPRLGRLSYDVAGSASGGWFVEGTPHDVSLNFGNDHAQLFLVRLGERQETQVASVGYFLRTANPFLLAADAAAPDWEAIDQAMGAVNVKVWGVGRDALPDLGSPQGTLRIQLIDATHLTLEWFDTHGPVDGFTSAARDYER